MRFLLLLLVLCATAVQAQQRPDSLVSYYTDSRAFLWPQPFAHVPQTFEAQAVRFTAPFNATLIAVDLRVDETSRSADNFNDTLRIGFYRATPDGTPDPDRAITATLDLEFAELTPGQTNRIDLGRLALLLAPGEEVWATFELVPAGIADTLVLVTGPKTDPPLFRAAARVAGQGWRLLTDTQFNGEFNFHAAALFEEYIGTSVDHPADLADAPVAITALIPQPARDEVLIGIHVSTPQRATAALFDLLGRRVRRVEVPVGAESIRFDTSNLAAGLYFLQVEAGLHRVSRPFVVAR